MDVLIKKALMNLLIWVLRLLDGIFEIFQQLAGLEKIQKVSGGETDIVDAFLSSAAITKVFFGVLIISAVVCAVAMVTAIVKATVNLNGGERKSIVRITGQGIGTIFISLAMAGIMITGIVLANDFLKEVHKSFGGTEQKLSGIVFGISVEDWTEYRPEYDDPNTPIVEDYDNPVWQVDANGEFMYDDEGQRIRLIFSYTPSPLQKSGWKDGSMPKDFDISKLGADEIYGKRPTNLIGVERSNKSPESDYLIELNGFNFLVGYFSGIILLVAVAGACLGLVKRLYDIVILFLSLPLMVATIPLDDGARFKVWRETVVSKIVIAYGAVFAVNVFLLMVPIIQGFAINPVFKMLLLVGGGLSISGGTLLFARLFGTDAAESRDLAQSARTLIAGGAAGIAGVKWTAQKTAGVAGGVRKGLTGVGKASGKLASLLDYRRALSGDASSGRNESNIMSSLGSGAYRPAPSPQSLPGSPLGVAMSTAGVKRGVWNKDMSNGKFITADRAAAIDNSTKGSSAAVARNSELQNRMKFKNPVTDNKRR
jgi:hypothetical protein